MERKIKLFFATTLDRFIAGSQGELDWLWEKNDRIYDAFIQDIDTIIIGKSTYETLRDLPIWPYPHQFVYVICRQPSTFVDDRVTFTSAPLAQLVSALKQQTGKHIWIAGGFKTLRAAAAEGLMDEIIMTIHPILLGEGIPLLPPIANRIPLSLIGHQVFDDNVLFLRYQVMHQKEKAKQVSEY